MTPACLPSAARPPGCQVPRTDLGGEGRRHPCPPFFPVAPALPCALFSHPFYNLQITIPKLTVPTHWKGQGGVVGRKETGREPIWWCHSYQGGGRKGRNEASPLCVVVGQDGQDFPDIWRRHWDCGFPNLPLKRLPLLP